MFYKAKNFNQCFGTWAEKTPEDVDTSSMFGSSGCTYELIPDASVGPWCQTESDGCVVPSVPSKAPSDVPSKEPSFMPSDTSADYTSVGNGLCQECNSDRWPPYGWAYETEQWAIKTCNAEPTCLGYQYYPKIWVPEGAAIFFTAQR